MLDIVEQAIAEERPQMRQVRFFDDRSLGCPFCPLASQICLCCNGEHWYELAPHGDASARFPQRVVMLILHFASSLFVGEPSRFTDERALKTEPIPPDVAASIETHDDAFLLFLLAFHLPVTGERMSR